MVLFAAFVSHMAVAAPCTDSDGDGWNILPPFMCGGSPRPGGDCNDGAALVHPRANDGPGDFVDQDCDGHDDLDLDGDGYTSDGDDLAADCSADRGINPGAEEDGVNGVDDDCDGQIPIRRDFIADASTLISASEFTYANVTDDSGRYEINAGAGGWLKARKAIPFQGGLLTVAVDLDLVGPSASCGLKVKTTHMGSAVTLPVYQGYNEKYFYVAEAGDLITELQVQCTGAGIAKLDWLSVQNGRYEWPPMAEIRLESSTMGYPGGGYQTFARLSEDYDGVHGLVMLGSDVGGMAWAPPHEPVLGSTVWTMSNGLRSEWDTLSGLAMADAYAFVRPGEVGLDPNDYDVYALAGNASGPEGLWCTSAIDDGVSQSWTLVDAEIGSNQWRDECVSSQNNKEFGSGHLIARYPGAADWLAVAGNMGDDRGVWLVDASVCGAATAGELGHFVGLPDAMPSALAPVVIDGANWLAVGYRPVMDGSGSDGALYLCEADFDPAGIPDTGACFPVLDGGITPVEDVRDIELIDESTLLVADGGRSVSWSGTEEVCSVPDESTVFIVTLTPDSGSFAADIQDTDDGTQSAPTWDSSGDYADCTAGADMEGNLGAPSSNGWGLAFAVSTVAVDPSGTWAFAFYPSSQREREYGCVRVFRAEVADLLAGLDDAWAPFQEYRAGELNFWQDGTTTPGAAERRGHVDMRGAFMASEPLAEVWAPGGALDAVFVEPFWVSAPGGSDLLVSGSFFWWAFQDDGYVDGAVVGWDSDESLEDLDLAEWALAWGEAGPDGAFGVPTLQSMTSIQAAVCPGCDTYGNGVYDSVLGGGSGDYAYALLHGAEDPSERPPADRPCPFQMTLSSGRTISVWYDRDDLDASPQAWLGMHYQGANEGGVDADEDGEADVPAYSDPYFGRALLFSGETIEGTNLADAVPGEIGMDWCVDAPYFDDVLDDSLDVDPGFAVERYLNSATDWQLRCQEEQWPRVYSNDYFAPCVTEELGDPFHMLPIGVPRQIVGIGENTALLLTTAAATAAGSSAADPESEGLWLVTYTGSTGLQYEKIEVDEDVCADGMFSYETGADASNHLSIHPDTDVDLGHIHAFVTSRSEDCGLYEVVWDVGNPPDWTPIPLDTGDCALDITALRGSTPRADGQHVLVWGAGSGNDICNLTIDPVYSDATSVLADTDEVAGFVTSLIEHPHVSDIFFHGFYQTFGCTTAPCPEPGVWGLERRVTPDGGEEWRHRLLSGDDFEHSVVTDVDVGPGTGLRDDPIRRIYATTPGAAFWETTTTW